MEREKINKLSLFEKLNLGIEVKCKRCGTGVFKKDNTDKNYKSYSFVCNKCDALINFDPVLDIE